MKIIALTNGPLLILDNHDPILDQDGKEYAPKNPTRFALCRCGASMNKPFCDGTHKKNGFEAPSQAEAAIQQELALGGWENEGGRPLPPKSPKS